MKKYRSFILFLAFFWLGSSYLQANVAIVVANTSAPTAADTGLIQTFAGFGVGVTPVPVSADLTSYTLVLVTSAGLLDKATVHDLMDGGTSVAAFWSASSLIGGNWVSTALFSSRTLVAEMDAAFLDGYRSTLSVGYQSDGSAFYENGGISIAGWTAIGRNELSFNSKTVFFREAPGGGRGLVIGYNPANFTWTGASLTERAFNWLTGTPARPGKTIPAGHVALVTTNPNDNVTTSLTASEARLRSWLEAYEIPVTIVSMARLAESDVSQAIAVVGTELFSINRYVGEAIMQSGGSVAYFSSAGGVIGGNWVSTSLFSSRTLVAEMDAAFLDGYRSTLSVGYQSDGSAFYENGGISIAGWTAIGRNELSFNSKTVFFREAPGGGSGFVIGYNPANFTWTGDSLTERAFNWLTGTPARPGKTVPAGHVALVTTNPNDNVTTSLTASESRLRSWFEAYEIPVTIVSMARLAESDVSQAIAVVGTELFSINRYVGEAIMQSGGSVAYFSSAGGVIGGNWVSTSLFSSRTLVAEMDAAFLDGYRSTLSVDYQSDGSAFYENGGISIAGWTAIGRNELSFNSKTVFFREAPGGGRGLVIGYNPAHFTWTGDSLTESAFNWLTGAPLRPGKAVPAGHVAMVIANPNDSSPANLTPEESNLYNRLLGKSLQVTLVSMARAHQSNLSGASMVAAVHYPSVRPADVDRWMNDGASVLLLLSSAASLADTWAGHSASSYRSLRVLRNEDFLRSFAAGSSFTVQSSGTAFAATSSLPTGWIPLAANTSAADNSRISALTRRHATTDAMGLIFAYDPRYLTTQGVEIFDNLLSFPTTEIQFLGWLETYFTLAELADPEISGAHADPDGDGLTNHEEFLLGTSPMTIDTSGDGIPDGLASSLSLPPLGQHPSILPSLINNGPLFGMYTEEMLRSMAVGGLLLEPTNWGGFQLRVELEESDDLTDWEAFDLESANVSVLGDGSLSIQFWASDSGVRFYRVGVDKWRVPPPPETVP